MRVLCCFLIMLLLSVPLISCDEAGVGDASSGMSNVTESHDEQPTERSTEINSLTYLNEGRMGDTDGPAFAVYSNIGYSGASVEINLASVEINTVIPGGKYLNGYSFLGVDVYDGDMWINCIDTGLCWAGKYGGWHLFYNIYETLNASTNSWYESRKIMPADDVYVITLDITDNNYATVTVEGKTNGFKDSAQIEIKGAKANGSNTAFLFNSALDFPPNTKVDSNGNPSENWVEITLANSDKGVYLKNLEAYKLTLYKGDHSLPWTNDIISSLAIWPDLGVTGFDYSPTSVTLFDGTKYVIDLDMNRK